MIRKNLDDKPAIKNKAIIVTLIGLLYLGLSAFCWLIEYSLLLPFYLFAVGFHLYFFRQSGFKRLLHLGLLLTLIVFTAHCMVMYTTVSSLYIPLAGISMLTMLLFNDLQLAFIMAFVSSALVGITMGESLEIMSLLFVGNLVGAYAVNDARTRGKLIGAGVFVSLTHVVGIVLMNPNLQVLMTKEFVVDFLYPLASSGFIAALLVAATLKIFESLFGVLTNYSLLELSDFNQPLLKRMVLEAPGTYHHSLVVSNLSEAAADAIGANALLTRVGAYYHDIGKMEKPEYFTENQLVGGNKHDNIEPSMSRLVILNHVKEGVDLAKKNKLNPMIIEFIPQHHGTSLIHYFYQKSLESAEKGEVIHEENFRYPGPRPQKRETAIVMLADSVEGAVRALDEPTPTKIETTVKKIINNKFIDGQLDECNLTLKEIDKITATFIRILGAMYHSRVKYPDIQNGNSAQKSTEKGPDASGRGEEPRQENSAS